MIETRRNCPFCGERPDTRKQCNAWKCGTVEVLVDDEGQYMSEPEYDTGTMCDKTVFRNGYLRCLELLRRVIDQHDEQDRLLPDLRREIREELEGGLAS